MVFKPVQNPTSMKSLSSLTSEHGTMQAQPTEEELEGVTKYCNEQLACMTGFIFNIKSTITDLKSAVKETVNDENRIQIKENAKKEEAERQILKGMSAEQRCAYAVRKKEEEV